MRLRGRRRPAGAEWVPNEILAPEVVDHPFGPIVLRLGPGLGLLDLPGDLPCHSVANVWQAGGQWVEALWPRAPSHGWFVAPIDLRLGHIVEFRREPSTIAGWVADANPQRFIFVVTADREQANEMAGLALDRWNRQQMEQSFGWPRTVG